MTVTVARVFVSLFAWPDVTRCRCRRTARVPGISRGSNRVGVARAAVRTPVTARRAVPRSAAGPRPHPVADSLHSRSVRTNASRWAGEDMARRPRYLRVEGCGCLGDGPTLADLDELDPPPLTATVPRAHRAPGPNSERAAPAPSGATPVP